MELARLATDIPDMRVRLGLGDTDVFGGTGMTFSFEQASIQESLQSTQNWSVFSGNTVWSGGAFYYGCR